MQYPIAIYQKHNKYHVIVPDIPELTTQADDIGDAVANGRSLVINHLYQLLEQDKTLPLPTPVSNHLSNPKFAGFTWAIVGIEISRIMGETIETTVNLPARLFKQISKQHRDEPLDTVIVNALKLYLNQSA